MTLSLFRHGQNTDNLHKSAAKSRKNPSEHTPATLCFVWEKSWCRGHQFPHNSRTAWQVNPPSPLNSAVLLLTFEPVRGYFSLQRAAAMPLTPGTKLGPYEVMRLGSDVGEGRLPCR